MTEQEQDTWLEDVWADREERVYRDLFGDVGAGIYTVPASVYERAGREADPRWAFDGVFVSPPDERRAAWTYVTSGLSTPWDQAPGEAGPGDPSGVGVELVLLTHEKAEWPIRALHWLIALQRLLVSGRIDGIPLDVHSRVPLSVPIDGEQSALRNVVLLAPTPEDGIASSFSLASGSVSLLLVVGLADEEKAFGKERGAEALERALRETGAAPCTDPKRRSIL